MGNKWKLISKKKSTIREWQGLKMFLFEEGGVSKKRLTMGLVELGPRKTLPSIRHSKTDEWTFVVKGSLVAKLNNDFASVIFTVNMTELPS